MKRRLTAILIVSNTQKDGSRRLASEIRAELESQGRRVELFEYAGEPRELPPERRFDLAITLGGDGTVLFASRVLAQRNVPILPVNLGDFGFISEVGHGEWQQAFNRYEAGEIDDGERLVLEVCAHREGRKLARFRGLNDAVVAAAGISKLVRLDVSLSHQSLGQYRADGVIVSTPTGSTAYSAAAGGPIVHPEMAAMIINPICPFTLSHRPLVIPADESVTITVEKTQRTDVVLTVDGQSLTPLLPADVVTIHAAEQSARIVRSDRRTFYGVLRSKLHWSVGPT